MGNDRVQAEALPESPQQLGRQSDFRHEDQHLTALSEDGVFPMGRVLARITGEEMEVHGGPMPLYGMILQGESEAVLLETGGEAVVPEAVADVAAWLATLQSD